MLGLSWDRTCLGVGRGCQGLGDAVHGSGESCVGTALAGLRDSFGGVGWGKEKREGEERGATGIFSVGLGVYVGRKAEAR